MSILLTAPGRYGDILWAMATAKAISAAAGEPVDLALSQQYSGLAELLRLQPYLRAVHVLDSWQVQETAPMTPRVPPAAPWDADWNRHIFLGYAGWPTRPLPYYVYDTVRSEHPDLGLPTEGLDLEQPWITIDGAFAPTEVAVGFTDEWYELKLGVTACVFRHDIYPHVQLTAPRSRWDIETPAATVAVERCDWLEAAGIIRNSDLFFGCCSALHVLACALGKRCVLMEPAEQRWNSIFYPYGQDGPRVRLVKGNDGQPTFDARHCADAVEEALRATAAL